MAGRLPPTNEVRRPRIDRGQRKVTDESLDTKRGYGNLFLDTIHKRTSSVESLNRSPRRDLNRGTSRALPAQPQGTSRRHSSLSRWSGGTARPRIVENAHQLPYSSTKLNEAFGITNRKLDACRKTTPNKMRVSYLQRNGETVEEETQHLKKLLGITCTEIPVLEDSIHPETFRSMYDVMPNIVQGAYKSVNHYLETHFRLLKEDFQSTLREGVQQYLIDPQGRHSKIWAYENVIVEYNFSTSDGQKKMFYKVTLPECKYYAKLKWKCLKRFMFGSLIVLTEDHFETYHMAIVESNNSDEPKKISILISFINSPPVDLENKKFLLVESKTFYLPYFNSMKVLKHMGQIDLPLKKYFVDAVTSPALPAYMTSNTLYQIGSQIINMSDHHSWPKAKDLGLNSSQKTAFLNALTREMALIQGPPGTGKTFLALKIITTLIGNKKNGYKNGPIMVVCYKNHSLDQLLVRLLDEGKKVVRIGGQSKVKALKGDCNVKSLKPPHSSFALKQEEQNLKSRLDSIWLAIKDTISIIKLLKSRIGIINLALLKEYRIVDPHLNLHLVQWLMEKVRVAPHEDSSQHPSSVEYDGSLRRLLGSSNLRSLFTLNLWDLGNHLIELEAALMDNNAISTEELKHIENINLMYWGELDRYDRLACGLKMTVDASDYPDPGLIKLTGYDYLSVENRWALYNKWEQDFIGALQDKLTSYQNEFSKLERNRLLNQERALAQKLIHAQPDVIGVTTCGASKHYSALASVGAKIILLEEAAEVLEAHVISSLSRKCEHLILIGDHQQLKPPVASYKLQKDYMMSVSLFERMINNGIKWSCLSTQHRMRPEISALICPSIYKHLENSPSVGEYPDVLGTKKNVFFFNHSHPEQSDPASESKFNQKEADMLLAICFHLIGQGYSPEEITILSTYAQQDRIIKKTIDKDYDETSLENVHHTVVDNYQGEENTIILLSLVRSNDTGNIGFLSTKNRVCVALSRAKHGLFMFGNMACLSEREPTIWSDIDEVLVSQESINTKFPLKCITHGNITEVRTPQDVFALRNAGCINPCGTSLDCGHTCRQMCHAIDQEHTNTFACIEKCMRKCANGEHSCNALCKDECPPCKILMPKFLVCGHYLKLECYKGNARQYCKETVEVILDGCGHTQSVLCRLVMTQELIMCKASCLTKLECGHICKRRCHVWTDPNHEGTHLCEERCERVNRSCPLKHKCIKKCWEPCGGCVVQVEKMLSCSHKATMKCSQKVEDFKCTEVCSRKLPCKHNCTKQCGDQCGPCTVKVKKVIKACGHKLITYCSVVASRSICNERCQTIMSCGHQCAGLCKDSCENQICIELIKVELLCGHISSVTCDDLQKRSRELTSECQTECQALLPCGHLCQGTCGSCLQHRVHLPCTRICGKSLVCSHKCKSRCDETYHTCTTRNCHETCWQIETKNQSLGTKEKGKNKFDPENQLIYDIRVALGKNCREIGTYVRDVASSQPISQMFRKMQNFVMKSFRDKHLDKRHQLCLLKTCLFKVEFMSVVAAIFERLTTSCIRSSKRLEWESLIENLLSRVSTENNNMGSYEMQQLQEQLFWLSLAIDAQVIGVNRDHAILDQVNAALKQAKTSFSHMEINKVFKLLRDFKKAAGVHEQIQTDPWDVMFSESAQWCKPIYHHQPPSTTRVKKSEGKLVTGQDYDNEDKKLGTLRVDDKSRASRFIRLNATRNIDVTHFKNSNSGVEDLSCGVQNLSLRDKQSISQPMTADSSDSEFDL